MQVLLGSVAHGVCKPRSIDLGHIPVAARSHHYAGSTCNCVNRLPNGLEPLQTICLQVHVTGVEQQAEGTSSYTAYVLEVEAEAGRSWQLRRRFSDFARLRSALKAHAGPAALAASWEELSHVSLCILAS